MSNKRITDLTELTNPTTDDVFPVVDIATNTTTKVQLGNLPVPTSVTTALATKENTITGAATTITSSNLTASKALASNASGKVVVSTVTDTELGYVSGVSSAIQTQINGKQTTLVSGTNIKTINSTSLLGSGDITISASPSGVSGAIQFSNGSAFSSDASNLFWDNTNKRLGIGTTSPTQSLEVLGNALINANAGSDATLSVGNSSRRWDIKAIQSGAYYQVSYQSTGLIGQSMDYQGNVAFGNFAQANARVHIKGSGSTSATTSLLVQNSAGTASLQVTDDGSVYNLGKGAITSNNGFGRLALVNNTTGTNNTAHGVQALQNNTTGGANTAVGLGCLTSNLTGNNNTSIGRSALTFITSGNANTAVGTTALYSTQGSNNTALGYEAGNNITSGAGNLCLGYGANPSSATASNEISIGSASVNAGAVDSSAFTQDKRWKVKINGVDYYIALQTA